MSGIYVTLCTLSQFCDIIFRMNQQGPKTSIYYLNLVNVFVHFLVFKSLINLENNRNSGKIKGMLKK